MSTGRVAGVQGLRDERTSISETGGRTSPPVTLSVYTTKAGVDPYALFVDDVEFSEAGDVVFPDPEEIVFAGQMLV